MRVDIDHPLGPGAFYPMRAGRFVEVVTADTETGVCDVEVGVGCDGVVNHVLRADLVPERWIACVGGTEPRIALAADPAPLDTLYVIVPEGLERLAPTGRIVRVVGRYEEIPGPDVERVAWRGATLLRAGRAWTYVSDECWAIEDARAPIREQLDAAAAAGVVGRVDVQATRTEGGSVVFAWVRA